jgi:hypothetical protein
VFQLRGAAGVHGFEIYGPDRRLAEWTGDDIGFLWGFAWDEPSKFPPVNLEFSYGIVPPGFQGRMSSLGVHDALPLDSNLVYTLHVQPAEGMPEYYSLHGSQIAPYKPDPTICWGSMPVEGRPSATVRVDCNTQKPLPMTPRAMERLKAYGEQKLPFF